VAFAAIPDRARASLDGPALRSSSVEPALGDVHALVNSTAPATAAAVRRRVRPVWVVDRWLVAMVSFYRRR
jgi:hypothetical protein